MSILGQSLEIRQRKIQTAKDYLIRTKELFEEFGSTELKTTHARFTELDSALSSSQARLVVLGEFTRGKSLLLNALLGINLLPTALETTTAINTFLRAMPEGRTEKFIMIHYTDGRAPQEVSWTEDSALIRWGTELDKSNADARLMVDHIEIFLDHPLLNNGLVLIDTPGLQTIFQHHEKITRKAIAESHIALWVQATDSLGGSASEWGFMSNTLQSNFQKFITVINKWDRVLEPEDYQDQQISEADRVKNKINIVKSSFSEILGPDKRTEFATLTDENHLMGVSAKWAQDKDPEKRRRSGVDKLAQRIAEMVSSGEAMEQILLKPLKQISSVQAQLAERISNEIRQLESTESLKEREFELKNLEADILKINSDSEYETKNSKLEHDNAANDVKKKVQDALTKPLTDLKNSIDDVLTESYVRQLIVRNQKNIGLPETLDIKFKDISATVSETWVHQKNVIIKMLADLRETYISSMNKHAMQIESGVSSLNVDLPKLEIGFDFDFSELEEYRKNEKKIKDELAAKQDEIDMLDLEIASKSTNDSKRRQKQAELDRASRQLENLGPAPAPGMRSERQKTSNWGSGFLFCSPTYERVQVPDYSNVETYKNEKMEMLTSIDKKEAELQKLIEEEYKLSGQKISLIAAKSKFEKRILKIEKEARDAAIEVDRKRESLIADSFKKLQRNTSVKIDEAIIFINKYISDAVPKVFSAHSKLLEECIRENILEPYSAKISQMQEVQNILEKGKAEIENRKNKLATALNNIKELQVLTNSALTK